MEGIYIHPEIWSETKKSVLHVNTKIVSTS